MSGSDGQSANMFSKGQTGAAGPTGGAKPPVAGASVVEAMPGGGNGASGAPFSGFTRAGPVNVSKVVPGRRPRDVHDPRLFPGIDVLRGMSKMREGSFSAESVMSKEEAGQQLAGILGFWGLLSAEDEGVIMGVVEQMWRSMAINGTSGAQPGRAQLFVGGQTFDMREVVDRLGEDYRRFARANADNIRGAVRRMLANVYSTDLAHMEQCDLLRGVAYRRGMQRHMDLCFDVADYCSELTMPEIAAISQSKEAILVGGVNVVDSTLAMGRANTAEGYQAGLGTDVNSAGGVQSGGRRH